eukprot:jgi/Bigna1/77676/fgenesh1_pg.49_\
MSLSRGSAAKGRVSPKYIAPSKFFVGGQGASSSFTKRVGYEGSSARCQSVGVDTVEAEKALEKVAGKSLLKCQPIGSGSAAPIDRITNMDLEKQVNTSDEWIAQRTGISSRHVLTGTERLSTLGAQAAENALQNAGVSGEDIDLVIVATSSPDDLFGDATSVAHQIGAKNAVAFDLTAACSGFMFGMITAGQYLDTGFAKNAVVVGADALSRWVDWNDRNSCILFGDGAGAVVMRSVSESSKAGMLGFAMHSDGAKQEHLVAITSRALPFDGEKQTLESGHQPSKGGYSPITMNGKEVYKFATSEVPRVINEALANAGMTAGDIDHLLLHQVAISTLRTLNVHANIRIMEVVAKKLGLSMDQVITNIDEYGNTSAGSMPLALDEAVRSGRVKNGDVIAFAGFGAGLSWGASIVRWGDA